MANNKTPMSFTLVLIFSLLVVSTRVDSRTLGDVPEITGSSPTIGVESTPMIVAESIPAIGSESTSTIDVPDTSKSISSSGVKSTPIIESDPLITDGSFPTIGGQPPLGIGARVFIGRKVDKIDDMSTEFVEIIYTQFNRSAVFVGKFMTVADTPHNRAILTKGERASNGYTQGFPNDSSA